MEYQVMKDLNRNPTLTIKINHKSHIVDRTAMLIKIR